MTAPLMPRLLVRLCSLIALLLVLPSGGHVVASGGVTPRAPYSVSVFATKPAGLSKPDSIAFNATKIFVGYGNGGDPGGCCGAVSNIIEYSLTGSVVKNFVIPGHNDGLKIDPVTGHLWALQNEDSDATLIIIDLQSNKMTTYNLGTGPHGGGYDDVAFINQSAFLSASNPSSSPNTAPAIVAANVAGKTVKLATVLNGNALATDATTGGVVTLNLQDPDSMIFASGALIMTSQADGELIIVQNPGVSCQQNFVVPLRSTAGGATIGNTQADDTVFASAPHGRILVSDKGGGAVYSITAARFAPSYYSAISTFTSDGRPINSFVGQTNLNTGFVTPVVTFNSVASAPGGMAFIPNPGENQGQQQVNRLQGSPPCPTKGALVPRTVFRAVFPGFPL